MDTHVGGAQLLSPSPSPKDAAAAAAVQRQRALRDKRDKREKREKREEAEVARLAKLEAMGEEGEGEVWEPTAGTWQKYHNMLIAEQRLAGREAGGGGAGMGDKRGPEREFRNQSTGARIQTKLDILTKFEDERNRYTSTLPPLTPHPRRRTSPTSHCAIHAIHNAPLPPLPSLLSLRPSLSQFLRECGTHTAYAAAQV